MPKFTQTPEGELEDFQKKIIHDLMDNDRPFSIEEEESEQKAEKYSLHKYPRIVPLPGTLGFRLRNIKGGNESVIRFMLNSTDKNRKRFINDFKILWDNMDASSRKRVDIFDILCEKYNISKKKFWGAIQEGMFDDSEAMTQVCLVGYGTEFLEVLKKMVRITKNNKDRELMAKILGLAKDTPFMQFTDNSKHETTNTNIQVNNNLPSFATSIKRSEKIIRQEPSIIEEKEEPKMLEEGSTEYIDAEWTKRKGNENDLVLARIEKNLTNSVKELT